MNRWFLSIVLQVNIFISRVTSSGQSLGLEYLTMIDQLIIKQKKEMLEAVTAVLGAGFETSNKYKIKNVLGQV